LGIKHEKEVRLNTIGTGYVKKKRRESPAEKLSDPTIRINGGTKYRARVADDGASSYI